VNLALALSRAGASVGLLDADIYGPSIPVLLGANQKPEIEDGQFLPVRIHGLELMSMGYLVDENDAMIWRGPMVSGALMQLLNQTKWSDLDYLIIDLPPGTGDIQLTLAQKIPVVGAVIVTTPHLLALADAKKAITMFKKVSIPILGLLENMVGDIFGQGTGRDLANSLDLALLASLPLDRKMSEQIGGNGLAALADDDLALAFPGNKVFEINKQIPLGFIEIKAFLRIQEHHLRDSRLSRSRFYSTQNAWI
jgi:ATP-binding protein involved in chromosome partitioning